MTCCHCKCTQLVPRVPARNIILLLKLRDLHLIWQYITLASLHKAAPTQDLVLSFPCKLDVLTQSLCLQKHHHSSRWKTAKFRLRASEKQPTHQWPVSLSPSTVQCIVAGSRYPTSLLHNCSAFKSSFFFSGVTQMVQNIFLVLELYLYTNTGTQTFSFQMIFFQFPFPRGKISKIKIFTQKIAP